ncbi:FtsX-like permease family protein [Lentibacillus salicampi]|uniref:ABC transporter permease n=1 Tax=Lentibacillus salicampi TaxID=175306 RepID=A0A4Y9ACB9_9BACI|nr:ABC transporter permease [Lentibacillus salicampi]TFJ92021.1 ABC transporter permease [Lentibacillus salicampi]
MSINRLIWQSLKKNIRNYYLYVFALVFSVALYFAFVTLQFDPALDAKADTVKGAAGIKVGSIMLVAIVAVFLLYANTLFIKRRSKEIGLFQLIGMTKSRIFRILSVENMALYVGSLVIGIFLGFAGSKLIKLIFFQITGIDQVAALNFSAKAMGQTVLVFLIIYLFIMAMNFLFVQRQSVLSLFQARSKTENVKKMSVVQILVGLLGIGLIAFGYYLSTRLFSGELGANLMFVMLSILGSVIIGTYLFFKGSVSFILQLIRKSKAGYLSINNVLSLSSIMFRMKSNAVLLTVITTVSALAIGLLSLTYISYYSAEKSAQQMVPNDFSITDADDADSFMKELEAEQIGYEETHVDFLTIQANIADALESSPVNYNGDLENEEMEIISDQATADINVSPDEAVLTGLSGAISQIISFQDQGDITLSSQTDTVDVHYTEIQEQSILPSILSFGFAVAVVDDSTYQQLAKNPEPDIQGAFGSEYIGIDIADHDQLKQANNIFQDWYDEEGNPAYSYLESVNRQKQATGLTMFIVGFLGLTFLITSGCILYFKQMDESEEEKSTYTILRKLGFTQGDLLRGIRIKQLFNFGIPLILGLLHSYFAVKSGWFMFGTEMVTPMVIVMLLYTVLYSIFGILSVLYYKRVIKEAL